MSYKRSISAVFSIKQIILQYSEKSRLKIGIGLGVPSVEEVVHITAHTTIRTSSITNLIQNPSDNA
jgi:hypothetical protein